MFRLISTLSIKNETKLKLDRLKTRMKIKTFDKLLVELIKNQNKTNNATKTTI